MNNTLIKNPVKNYKLDLDYNNYDDGEPEPLFDEYGNPTPETLRACRELELGLGEKMTLDEFLAWTNEVN